MVTNQTSTYLSRSRLALLGIQAVTLGVLFWANLRISGKVHFFWYNSIGAPQELDPITRFMFFRGWPIAPFEWCVMNTFEWQGGRLAYAALLVDLLIAGAIFFSVRWVGKRILCRIPTISN